MTHLPASIPGLFRLGSADSYFGILAVTFLYVFTASHYFSELFQTPEKATGEPCTF